MLGCEFEELGKLKVISTVLFLLRHERTLNFYKCLFIALRINIFAQTLSARLLIEW